MKRCFLTVLLILSGIVTGTEFEFRPLFPEGNAFRAEIQLTRKTEFQLVIPGSESPVIRENGCQIVFFGNIRVEKTAPSGTWERLLIETDYVSGSVNGHILDSALLSGKRISAVSRNGETSFVFADGRAVPKRAGICLKMLFAEGKTSLRLPDLFGTKVRFRKPGDTWKPDQQPVLNVLKNRGFQAEKLHLVNFAQYEGKKKSGKIPCLSFRTEWTVPESAWEKKTKRSAGGYDLRYRLRVILPEDPSVRDAGKIERQAMETVQRHLGTSDPALSGASVRLSTAEKLMFLLQPYQERKEERESFLDRLLR